MRTSSWLILGGLAFYLWLQYMNNRPPQAMDERTGYAL